MDEKRLLGLLFDRAEEAIGELAQAFGKRLSRTALNLLGSHEDAQECVNDTYLAVWNAIPPAKPEPLAPYVYRTGRNIALNRLRARTAGKRGGYILSLEELAHYVPAPEGDRELGQALNDWLDTLKKEDRAVFLRRYWFGDSVKDIARSLGRTENAVSVRLHRLKNDLKAYLTKEGYYYE